MHRTLVDLPGLTYSSNLSQTEADKDLILNLVKEYISNPRTIILAVVSAKNDMANQIIVDYARKADRDNKRTLGIITKPDYLREGSDNELSWIEIALNKDVYLERGWHMLKNRGDDEMDFSFAERNDAETSFFSIGRYKNLPRENVGVGSLRERLSKLLLDHLVKELPSLQGEMETKLGATNNEIIKLGEKRSTSNEQRLVLMKVSMKINDILKSAVKGKWLLSPCYSANLPSIGFYEGPFFGNIDMGAAVDAKENIRRFRAVVQHRNLGFAEDMRLRGHKFDFGVGPGDDDQEMAEAQKAEKELKKLKDGNLLLPKPKSLSRDEAVEWVKKTLERSRGYELPGTFQPMLISQLFWEQSQPWEKIALEHITSVATICRDFVYNVLGHAAPAEFVARITSLSVDKALKDSLTEAKEELTKLIKDNTRHPMTYNRESIHDDLFMQCNSLIPIDYFTTTIQKQRQRKHQKLTTAARKGVQEEHRMGDGSCMSLIRPEKMEEAMTNAIEQDMDNFSSQEALDYQRAYYKVYRTLWQQIWLSLLTFILGRAQVLHRLGLQDMR